MLQEKNFEKKYLKYKHKYYNLQNQRGGHPDIVSQFIEERSKKYQDTQIINSMFDNVVCDDKDKVENIRKHISNTILYPISWHSKENENIPYICEGYAFHMGFPNDSKSCDGPASIHSLTLVLDINERANIDNDQNKNYNNAFSLIYNDSYKSIPNYISKNSVYETDIKKDNNYKYFQFNPNLNYPNVTETNITKDNFRKMFNQMVIDYKMYPIHIHKFALSNSPQDLYVLVSVHADLINKNANNEWWYATYKNRYYGWTPSKNIHAIYNIRDSIALEDVGKEKFNPYNLDISNNDVINRKIEILDEKCKVISQDLQNEFKKTSKHTNDTFNNFLSETGKIKQENIALNKQNKDMMEEKIKILEGKISGLEERISGLEDAKTKPTKGRFLF